MVRRGAVAVEEVTVEAISAESAVMGTDWGAIFGGALGAIGISIILFTAGSGFGLSAAEPWTFTNQAPETFAIGTGIWLIVMQWLSSGFGGYMAGRLRSKWLGVRTDEVFFRDTAHGLLAWALATLLVATLFALGTFLAGATAAAGAAAAGADAVAGAAGAAGANDVSPETANAIREAAASFSIFTAISLLIGAFIGGVSGALGGYHRDAL